MPKLKYEHVYLTSFSKMRVDLAAHAGICNTLKVHFSVRENILQIGQNGPFDLCVERFMHYKHIA